MVKEISVVIIVKNGAKTIRWTLDSLKDFEEVVVFNNGSTDETESICKSFDNVKFIEGEFTGFGSTKNTAISYAKYDWILSLDCDEVLSKTLRYEIEKLSLDTQTVYRLRRDNYYANRVMRCCGWDNDYVYRLFNRNTTSFKEQLVHESLETKGLHSIKLREPIQHYPYENIDNLLLKVQRYSTLYALEHQGKKNPTVWGAFTRAWFAFIKHYFFQKGFLYGYEGVLISVTNANHVFYKYMKLIEVQRDKNRRIYES